jgi:hypothetical protein
VKRLVHDAPGSGCWEERLPDGRVHRGTRLRGAALHDAHAQVKAERELEQLRAQVAEEQQRAASPPAQAPAFDAGRPVPRMNERELDAMGIPINSGAPDRFRAGQVPAAWKAGVRQLGSHPELDD